MEPVRANPEVLPGRRPVLQRFRPGGAGAGPDAPDLSAGQLRRQLPPGSEYGYRLGPRLQPAERLTAMASDSLARLLAHQPRPDDLLQEILARLTQPAYLSVW